MKEEKRKAPKLRFPGFDGDWEQRKFGDVGSVSMCKRIFKEETSPDGEIPFYKIGTFGAEPDAYISRELYEDYRAKFAFPEKGDILLSASGTIGRIVEYNGEDAYFQDSNIVWLSHDKTISNKFLKVLYPTVQWDGIEGSTIKRLYNDNFLRTQFSMPKIEEQEQLGSFFSDLDKIITLHQRKLDQIKEYKKGMLQKMFPKKGETVPEVRFPGFEGDWEERMFSNFTRDVGRRNKDNLKLEPYAVTNDRGFIRQADAHDEFGYMKNVDRKAYNIVPPKAFAYNPARINVGSIGYYDGTESVIVSSLYEVFQTDDSVDDRFLWHWFKSDFFPEWIEKLQEGSVRFYFYYDKLCECHMLMPSIDEQRKISDYIDTLDTLISLHQQKLDEMKEYKKGLLQQMFV